MAVDHYENFPVASLLLPARLRPAVAAVYAFARGADDIADEGEAAPEERIAGLDAYERELDRIAAGEASDAPRFRRLGEVIAEHALPLQCFRDLLSAFRQDVRVKRYDTFADVLDYCRRSADPVGAIMLHLYRAATPKNIAASNAICSSLQLINFWQDVAIDWRKDRVYIPQEDLRRHGVSEAQLANAQVDRQWHELMQFEIDRTRAMMLSGASLALRLPGRIGWELRLVVQGGLRILEKIEAADHDVFRRRPVLGKSDYLRMAWRAMQM